MHLVNGIVGFLAFLLAAAATLQMPRIWTMPAQKPPAWWLWGPRAWRYSRRTILCSVVAGWGLVVAFVPAAFPMRPAWRDAFVLIGGGWTIAWLIVHVPVALWERPVLLVPRALRNTRRD
jgi:hypothetical protein